MKKLAISGILGVTLCGGPSMGNNLATELDNCNVTSDSDVLTPYDLYPELKISLEEISDLLKKSQSETKEEKTDHEVK